MAAFTKKDVPVKPGVSCDVSISINISIKKFTHAT